MKKNRIGLRPENTLESILSLPCVVAALKAVHPEAEVGLVLEENHYEAAYLIPGVEFVEDSADGPWLKFFDLRDSTKSFQENPEWKAYSRGCVNLAATNPYHQVDLWKKVARVDDVESNYELVPPGETAAGLPESLLDDSYLRVILCTASLGIDELQVTLEALSRVPHNIRIFLTGTVSQRRKSLILLSAWDEILNIVDLCGKLSLAQSAESFRLCDIAITGPGASALLSSGFGTFTICVDETGNPLQYPYGHGHLIVQPSSSDELAPLGTLITEVMNYAITGNGGALPSLEQWRDFADTHVDNYLGRLRLLGTQRVETLVENAESFTELQLRPLIYLGADLGDTGRAFYRLLWEHHLQGRSLTSHDLNLLHEDTITQLCDALKPLQQLAEVANFGRVYSAQVRASLMADDIVRAREESGRVQEVEDLLHQLAEAQAFLAPLCGFHAFHQKLIPESTPLERARRMEQLFLSIQSRVTVLLDLAQSLFSTTMANERALNGGSGSPEEGSFHG
jgi:hypothetical protein